MSDVLWVAIIAAVPGTIAAIQGFRNRSAIKEVHLTLNSRLSELIAASKDTGRIEERAEQRTEAEKK